MKKSILLCCILFLCFSCQTHEEKVRFLVFTDLHHDLIPDAKERLQVIIEQAEKNQVDFIMDIGDFAFALPENQPIKDIVNATSLEMYHVIGNHDADKTSKQEYIDYWGLPSGHYYVDKGKFRFIILDSNFFIDKEGNEHPYDHANYFGEGLLRERFSKEQHGWLKNLLNTDQICVIFSHGPINDGYKEVIDNKSIHEIIIDARKKGTRIAAAFAGHIHSDNYHVIDDINYLQVNSASYIWGGERFLNTERYTEELNNKYPALKYTIPYESALYAIVEIDSSGKITITGSKSKYLEPAPDEDLLKTQPYPCSAEIRDREISF